MDGFLCVKKSSGPSSFAIVKKVRSALKHAKAGHAGTLDPLATGLLIVALGKATRLLPYLPVEPKTYRFSIKFGMETDTLDASGEVAARSDRLPAKDEIEAVMPQFIGDVMQVPPRFSSVKISGTRAYKLARMKTEFEPHERRIHVHRLSLIHYNAAISEAALEVVCSGGTYVRSLARDIALALGSRGFASSVERTAAGRFGLAMAVSSDDLKPESAAAIISIPKAFEGFPSMVASPAQRQILCHGMELTAKITGSAEMPLFAYDESGALLALLQRRHENVYRPLRVFCS